VSVFVGLLPTVLARVLVIIIIIIIILASVVVVPRLAVLVMSAPLFTTSKCGQLLGGEGERRGKERRGGRRAARQLRRR
jgi:uncharacterized membrane protein YqiK